VGELPDVETIQITVEFLAEYCRRGKRVDELLAANNVTEEQRREAARQCRVARDTIQVLQEALGARNETISVLKGQLSSAPKPIQADVESKNVITLDHTQFRVRIKTRREWEDSVTSTGSLVAWMTKLNAMLAEAPQGVEIQIEHEMKHR
jgi:hypothetical protein